MFPKFDHLHPNHSVYIVMFWDHLHETCFSSRSLKEGAWGVHLRLLGITWSAARGNLAILLVLVFSTDEHSGSAGFVIEPLCLRSSMKTRSSRARLSLSLHPPLAFPAWCCFWFSTLATCARAYSSFAVIPRTADNSEWGFFPFVCFVSGPKEDSLFRFGRCYHAQYSRNSVLIGSKCTSGCYFSVYYWFLRFLVSRHNARTEYFANSLIRNLHGQAVDAGMTFFSKLFHIKEYLSVVSKGSLQIFLKIVKGVVWVFQMEVIRNLCTFMNFLLVLTSCVRSSFGKNMRVKGGLEPLTKDKVKDFLFV